MSDEYFQTFVTEILLENWAKIGRHLSVPLIVYEKARFVVLRTSSEREAWLRTYRDSLRSIGASAVRSTTKEQNWVSSTMASYLVKQSYVDRNGVVLGFDTVRYFVRSVGDVPAIEMIEQF